MHGKHPLKISKKFKLNIKISILPKCEKKNAQKIAIILKIAKNRGRNIPEGQVSTKV